MARKALRGCLKKLCSRNLRLAVGLRVALKNAKVLEQLKGNMRILNNKHSNS